MQDAANLLLVAAHQNRIFKGVLAHLPDLGEVLVERLQFLLSDDRRAVRLPPDDRLAARRAHGNPPVTACLRLHGERVADPCLPIRKAAGDPSAPQRRGLFAGRSGSKVWQRR